MRLNQTLTKTVTLPTNGVFRCMTCTIPQKGSETYLSDTKDILRTVDKVIETDKKTVEEIATKKDPLSTLFAIIGTGKILEKNNPKLLKIKNLYFKNESGFNNETAIKKAIEVVGDQIELNVNVTI